MRMTLSRRCLKWQQVLILFVAMAVSGPVWAKKKVIYRKTQEVNFNETPIDGKVRSPDGVYLNQKSSFNFVPLYKIKENFDRRVKESVEYLR